MKEDNALAFEVLYHRYWKKLFVTAVNKTQDQDLAQEITQEIFVDLWERRATLKISNVSAYLNAAIRFKVISAYKSQLETQIEYLEIPDNSTHDTLALQDFEKSLSSAVALLPEKTREVFQMSRFEQKTVKEISAKLQMPERTVEYHITQSLRFLRLHLQDYFLSFSFFMSKMVLYYFENFLYKR
jgi:RNA polymerase sigma-70 factor (family 1)